MADFVLGKDAKAYYAFAGTVLASMTELTNVRDVTLNLERAEADVTTRANSGWRGTAAALRDASVDFEMIWKPGDAGFDAVLKTFLDTYGAGNDEGTIELAFLDGDKTTSGSQGLKGSFSITSFNRGEPLEEAVTVSVTAKLTTFDQWVTV